MNIDVKQKALSKELAENPSRIVLGRRDVGLVMVILFVWFTWVAGIAWFMLGLAGADFQLIVRIAPGAIAMAYLLVGLKSRLTLDLGARTYLHEYGLAPFVRRRR